MKKTGMLSSSFVFVVLSNMQKKCKQDEKMC